MGLDISYYRDAKRLRDMPEDGDYDWENGEFAVWVNPHFIDRADGLASGIYSSDAGGGFRAGSYGGYGQWRDWLAKLAGYPLSADPRHPHASSAWEGAATGLPFVELINFSDCDGAIGPATSKKLAADFASMQPAVDALAGPDSEWFKRQYAEWRKAFETAADHGVVVFH